MEKALQARTRGRAMRLKNMRGALKGEGVDSINVKLLAIFKAGTYTNSCPPQPPPSHSVPVHTRRILLPDLTVVPLLLYRLRLIAYLYTLAGSSSLAWPLVP